jgi:hypothetical protein
VLDLSPHQTCYQGSLSYPTRRQQTTNACLSTLMGNDPWTATVNSLSDCFSLQTSTTNAPFLRRFASLTFTLCCADSCECRTDSQLPRVARSGILQEVLWHFSKFNPVALHSCSYESEREWSMTEGPLLRNRRRQYATGGMRNTKTPKLRRSGDLYHNSIKK